MLARRQEPQRFSLTIDVECTRAGRYSILITSSPFFLGEHNPSNQSTNGLTDPELTETILPSSWIALYVFMNNDRQSLTPPPLVYHPIL